MDHDNAAAIGFIAHIVAHSPGGPRADPDFPLEALDTCANWIPPCPNHPALVDAQPETYDAQTLRDWKAQHEQWVVQRLAPVPGRAELTSSRERITLYRLAWRDREPWQSSVGRM